jgi:hypothetical protein
LDWGLLKLWSCGGKGPLSPGWHPYLDFKMDVVFSCERLITAYETSHFHSVEDHSLNFPSFYFLYVALSISVYVRFRTRSENHVIFINWNVCHATVLSFF